MSCQLVVVAVSLIRIVELEVQAKGNWLRMSSQTKSLVEGRLLCTGFDDVQERWVKRFDKPCGPLIVHSLLDKTRQLCTGVQVLLLFQVNASFDADCKLHAGGAADCPDFKENNSQEKCFIAGS
jgi:hypothetical protein